MINDNLREWMDLFESNNPSNTIKGYKLFRIDPKQPGKIFPLFIQANVPVPFNVWLPAVDSAYFIATNGNKYVPALTGDIQIPAEHERERLFNDGILKKINQKGIKSVKYRPGWHAGTSPMSTHLGKRSIGSKKVDQRPSTQVWAEVEVPADVDWQKIANDGASRKKNGEINIKTADIDEVPENGYYKYKTNVNMTGEWIIAGAIKVTRILDDDQVLDINDEHGVMDLPRAEGDSAQVDQFIEVGGYSASEANTELDPEDDFDDILDIEVSDEDEDELDITDGEPEDDDGEPEDESSYLREYLNMVILEDEEQLELEFDIDAEDQAGETVDLSKPSDEDNNLDSNEMDADELEAFKIMQANDPFYKGG